MNDTQLIRMGNQIATFFESFPDRPEGLRETASHLRKFWTPAMRQQLLARLDAGPCAQASAMLVAAVQAHRGLIQPA